MKNSILLIAFLTIISCSKSNDAVPSKPTSQTVTINITTSDSQCGLYVNNLPAYLQDLKPITLKLNDSLIVKLNMFNPSNNDTCSITIKDGNNIVAYTKNDYPKIYAYLIYKYQ